MMHLWCLVFLMWLSPSETANDLSVKITTIPKDAVIVHKCCEDDELINHQFHCAHVNHTDSQPWSPIFSDEKGTHNVQTHFRIVNGFPSCGTTQEWPVYHYQGSSDRLILLPSGLLRHYTNFKEEDEENGGGITQSPLSETGERRYYDYPQGTYCLDKALTNVKENTQNTVTIEVQGAIVCVPVVATIWANSEFIIRKVLDPILHTFAIFCFLSVAIVYFVLPPLRDLVGNMLTTIMVCLIVTQAADMVRIFTEFSNHISFMVADFTMYLSLLAAFFWLNSLGYYIYRTFRSRNVFLRVTDGRKYCYYSTYAWGATLGFAGFALAAHFLFDDEDLPVSPHGQKTIGWLGIAMFFTPIAFTVIVDIFFYLATGQKISRMSTYGRIHNKMKFSFEMFIKLFLAMLTAWLFLLLSWLRYDSLIYTNIAVNALQAPVILVICVLSQKRVIYLLKKTCCYQNCLCSSCRPDDNDPSDWGEEMMAMNAYNC